MTDDNLAWEIMRDHYRLLYLTSPGFRETVNWKSQTLTEMIHGGSFWLYSKRYTPKREAFVKKQHEQGVKALEIALDIIVRRNPALAAERRCEVAEPVVRTMSREDERFYRALVDDMVRGHERVKQNWHLKNQEQLEGNA